MTRAIALCGLALVACGGGVTDRDQWTVWLTTDAPVPQLADRALVEILNEDGTIACSDCRRQLGIPTEPSAWPISFGVAYPEGVRTVRVRVRLYRAARVGDDGLPAAATALDATAVLPPPAGNTEVSLVVPGECIGIASDAATRKTCSSPGRGLVDEPVLPLGRPDGALRPGTWPRAATVPCQGAPEEMICVPGGFFVLGDASDTRGIDRADDSARDERFVTVSPFAIDRDEVTVGAVRALVKSGRLALAPTSRAPSGAFATCTYLGADDPANDAFAVNCVSFTLATEACRALGKRLPAEVEWEWAAGNLTAETPLPWTGDGDVCERADVGLGFSDVMGGGLGSTACRFRAGEQVRPAGLPASANPGDQTALGIRRLGGGLAEWIADERAPYHAPCWTPDEPFLKDPRCAHGGDGVHVLRGASWAEPPGLLRVTAREGAPDDAKGSRLVGFRCALSQGAGP